MEDNRLLIGGIVIIALLVAIPIVGPMIRGNGYDAVADSHKIDTLKKAVENYARINQQYPPSLHFLVPEYLEAVPLTSTNLQFQYDPRTGQISNPSAPVPEGTQNAGRQGSGGGGISPATDAMTGLSVSEELNF